MKIAVIAKDRRHFEVFLSEIHSNKRATEIFKYVRNLDDIVGTDFDAVITTYNAWQNNKNHGLKEEIVMRINYKK